MRGLFFNGNIFAKYFFIEPQSYINPPERQLLCIYFSNFRPMNFTDTHIHLYASEFGSDREKLMDDALRQGITRFFMPNIDSSSAEAMLQLSQKYPDTCFPMMGLHPCSVKENFADELRSAEAYFSKGKFFAIGEIGIDLFWDKTYFEQQKVAFVTQCAWAVEKNLPVVIHTRNSFPETISVLKSIPQIPRGIFHCFSGTIEDANKVTGLGFYLGIGGVVTFKNSDLDKVVKAIDLKHLVLETDAPYLAPIPHRGKRNEPDYLLLIAQKIAEIKKISVEEVAEVTTQNSIDVFGC